MSPIHDSPHTAPITDNVQMDIDSNSEAEQAAWEFTQAQEQLQIANKARERHREEWEWKEEEEKDRQQIAAIEAAQKEAEEVLERENSICTLAGIRQKKTKRSKTYSKFFARNTSR